MSIHPREGRNPVFSDQWQKHGDLLIRLALLQPEESKNSCLFMPGTR
jgi:hypothetical protein